MRNRLKETSSKHFSERLYYADHPSEDVTPCFNGNISAIHTAWLDTVNTYAYAYDMQNRLLSSKRLTANSTSKSESFGYDAEGNISSLKRYSGNRLIDDLVFDYGNDGNQLLSVADAGENADLYSTIEYRNSSTQSDTTLFYDANGNLIRNIDRAIHLQLFIRFHPILSYGYLKITMSCWLHGHQSVYYFYYNIMGIIFGIICAICHFVFNYKLF